MREGMLAYLAIQAGQAGITGKSSFQKLVYFLQAKGVPLDYRYSMNFFGPYSEPLADDIDELSFEGVLRCETEGVSILVKPGPAAQLVVKDEEPSIASYVGDVGFILEHLARKPAIDLDLLSTAHFLAQHMKIESVEDLAEKVHRIKDGKFSLDKISDGIKELEKLDLLNTPELAS